MATTRTVVVRPDRMSTLQLFFWVPLRVMYYIVTLNNPVDRKKIDDFSHAVVLDTWHHTVTRLT